MVATAITSDLARILAKDASSRTQDETKILDKYSSMIPRAMALNKNRQAREALKQRNIEQEESLESIENKSIILANLIRESQHTIIYTGAGISTAASIPDYRGPNGLWTQLRKTGSFSMTQIHDLTNASPTYTHMAISELCRRQLVKHIVSQNCDGLHLRSGIPQKMLSEIHGNMYIEICPACEKQYYRQADLTEKTSRFRHKTGRKCHSCTDPNNNNLSDTIVLFGERSRSKLPMNWEAAAEAAKKSTLIICLGSSLKTLRRYECLWPKSLTSISSKRSPETKLAIVNLQYTSKDKHSILKINGKCDQVMQFIMHNLNIDVPKYEWTNDPLYRLAIPFSPEERIALQGRLLFESKQSIEVTKQTSISTVSSQINEESSSLEQDTNLILINTANRFDISSNQISNVFVDNKLIVGDVNHEHLLNSQNINQEIQTTNIPTRTIPGWLGKGLGGGGSKYVPKKRKRRYTNK